MTIQYDPQAESERPVRLPDAPIQELGPGIKLQPPLSRRGHGPGVIAVLPSRLSLRPHAKCGLKTPLDPDPVQKWAEEGFAVVGVQLSANSDITETLAVAIAGLESCPDVDNKGRYAVLGECYCGTRCKTRSLRPASHPRVLLCSTLRQVTHIADT